MQKIVKNFFPEPEDAIGYGNKLKFTKTKIQLLNFFVGFIQESRDIFQISFNKNILNVVSY